jgi:hypothetical protein
MRGNVNARSIETYQDDRVGLSATQHYLVVGVPLFAFCQPTIAERRRSTMGTSTQLGKILFRQSFGFLQALGS